MAFTQAEARRHVERIVGIAKKAAPGADVEVYMRHTQRGQTRFAVNEVSTAAEVEVLKLELRLSYGLRSAAVRVSQLDDVTVRDAAVRGARLAKIAPEQAERQPLLGPQKYLMPQGTVDGALRGASAALRAEAAKVAIMRAEADKVVIAGFVDHEDTSVSVANSAGLAGYFEYTRGSFDCTARTQDGTGSGWAGSHSNRWADLDVAAYASTAIDKAVKARAPRRLDPGRYTVVLEPAAVAELLGAFVESLKLRNAQEGRSFFSRPGGETRIGETLWPSSITLRSDPADVALPFAPWNDESLPLSAAAWIEKGKLERLPVSRYWAKQKSLAPIPYPRAFELAGGSETLAQLIAGVKRGVLITRFWYLNYLDPNTLLSTGLTRDGTFLIENGEIAGPVNNFRFNESPHTMLKNCDGLGKSLIPPVFDIRVPALRTHEFNLASISEAV
ncbi:MAG TPA: TldD/PmbA family protein [Polyangiales bacterium]|nr:TldD/PmbA family protein [Polyangiales bacterium]